MNVKARDTYRVPENDHNGHIHLSRFPIEVQEHILLSSAFPHDIVNYCDAHMSLAICKNPNSYVWQQLYERYTDYPLPPGMSHARMCRWFASLRQFEDPDDSVWAYNYHSSRFLSYDFDVNLVEGWFTMSLDVMVNTPGTGDMRSITTAMSQMYANDPILSLIVTILRDLEAMQSQWSAWALSMTRELDAYNRVLDKIALYEDLIALGSGN